MPDDDVSVTSGERVLVLPVTRRDGEVTCLLLKKAGVECIVCKSLQAMAAEISQGVGALMLTESALASSEMPLLLAMLRGQPAWSDVPVVMLMRDHERPVAGLHTLETLGNVTVLDRPVSTRSMISAIQSALRDRRKQYRIRDQIMQQARAEQALKKADQRKDEFLATLAHELRNPLAPIRTGLHILSRLQGENEKSLRVHEIMERQMGQMVKLIDELLEVSRISTGKVVLQRSRVDMRAVIGLALEGSQPLVDAARHTLELRTLDEPVWVIGDPSRLAQVVSNLVNNAAKYTPNGGRIRVVLSRQGGEAVVSVEDNGVGIPENMLQHVFDMFAQINRTLDRAQGGLGIGLALVHRLMELHGGSVAAESGGADRGSRFTIRLPAVAGDSADEAADDSAAGGAWAKKHIRILIVDDNTDAAETLAMLLETHGHQTRSAYSAQTGLRLADEFRPEVVFCDIEMAGMNGYEVATRLRSDPVHAPAVLVAVTGRGT
ncbi:MAG TPA: hybrid sensor histidine kinase/response regulator, partial [Rhizobacter sp.]|nr:hybrid sensor histidine kinase/response regulator [Rhizobacter sp.]